MSMRIVLLLMGLALTAWLSFSAPDGGSDVAEVVERPAGKARAVGDESGKRAAAAQETLQALKRRESPYQLFDESLATELAQKEPPIFHSQTWNPPAPKASAKPEPPKAPPLPYLYLGKQSTQGVWWVYLLSGEDTRAVTEGQVLDGKYRIDRIAPPLLTMTYLPLNEVQTMNIGTF